jgi:uncharacterized protein (DUF433 family)
VIDTFRTGKAYTVAQAGRLAGTSPQNVARWLRGYAAPGHQMAPVFGERAGQGQRAVSFLELAEIIVVARFRRPDWRGKRPVRLETLRRAYEYARRTFGLEYPFASLNLKLEGGHILHDFNQAYPGTELLALDLGGQWALPVPVQRGLEQFEFDPQDHLARRWFPLGPEGRIVVDPHVGAGRPTIVGTGVTVDIIRRRFLSNESVADIAEDFEITAADVEQALRYADVAA